MHRPTSRDRSVAGSDLHLQKVPDGDWAQKKVQQRSENQWHENAQLAVAAIEHLPWSGAACGWSSSQETSEPAPTWRRCSANGTT